MLCARLLSGGLFAACGEGEDTPAHTHTMTLHAAVEAGCTESGSVAYWECGGCGKKFADEAGEQELTDVVVPALGHDYEWEVTKEAACTETGTRTGVCSRCEGEKTEPIAALEHAFGEWAVVTPAGCESAGEEARSCTRQGCTHRETRPLEATGHDYEWEVTKEATCTEAGTRTGVCSRCGDEKTETIAALGGSHSYALVQENGAYYHVCSRCGDKVELEAGDAEEFPLAVTAENQTDFIEKLSAQKALYVRLDGNVSLASYLFSGAFGTGTGAVYIDLNGNSLSLTGTTALAVGRDLSMGNGTFSVPYGITVGSDVSLNFLDVEVTALSATCFTVTGDSSLSFAGETAVVSGQSNGRGKGYGIHVQASADGASVSLSGFSSSVQSFNADYCGILFEAEGELSVSGGSVTGRGQGVVMRAGSATFEAARLYARLETETFAVYSQDASTWGTGNQVAYGGLVACGTAQVKFVNSCYCVGDARISAATPYKIGIYAYGENVSVDFREATSLTIDKVFVNFDDTANVTGYSGTVSDSWNGTAFADSDAAA